MAMKIIAKYIHGSENSLDTDVMYVVDELPSLQECKIFCSEKAQNRNLIVINDGVVVSCYKGTPDECNNSLYRTYNLHEQEYPLLIERTVPRDKTLKAIRAVRGILSHLSKSQYRPIIKEALRSEDWNVRVEALNAIHLHEIDFDNIQNNMTGADIKKLIAFQMAQTVALFEDNDELYTKNEVIKKYPILEWSINRKLVKDIVPDEQNNNKSTKSTGLTYFYNTFRHLCASIDTSGYDVKKEIKIV